MKMAEFFEYQGNQLAEDEKYSEAFQAAITLMPQRAILHEQEAQVLLEMGDAWPGQPFVELNYGEPDLAIKSFDKALAIKPSHEEAVVDRETVSHLVKRRKQLHSTD